MTKEDIENQKRADYEISYGSDKVEEMQVANIDWVADGIHYSILDMGAKESPESLFSMRPPSTGCAPLLGDATPFYDIHFCNAKVPVLASSTMPKGDSI